MTIRLARLFGGVRESLLRSIEIYIKPLHSANKTASILLAPNVYVEKKVRDTYLSQISEFFERRGQEINLWQEPVYPPPN